MRRVVIGIRGRCAAERWRSAPAPRRARVASTTSSSATHGTPRRTRSRRPADIRATCTVNDCRPNASDRKIGIFNLGAAGNTAYKQFMYVAPANTHIETVCLDYNLRRDSHHQAELLAYPGFQVLASGGDGPAGWTSGCFDLNHSQFIVRLACANAGGCPEGLNAHAYVRNITIALADDVIR